MNQKQIRAAVEAMLFACGEPIGSDKLAQAVQLPQTSVENALEELRTRYTREDSGLCLLHLNTRWQLATKTEWADCVRRVLDSRRAVPLGPAAMETLTVIAYNQPVSRAFIEQVRGVDSSSSVSGLLEKGLIEEAGRLDLPGRPVSFRTTDTFLRVFGLSSLADLPPVHQPDIWHITRTIILSAITTTTARRGFYISRITMFPPAKSSGLGAAGTLARRGIAI